MSTWPTIHATRAFVLTDMEADAWVLRTATPERSETGPDTLKLVYEGRFDPAAGAAPSTASFFRGAVPAQFTGAGTWRVVSALPTRMSGPFWRLEVTAKGAIDTQQPKIRWVTGSTSFQAEQISVPGMGLVPKVSARQPEVGMEVGYLAIAATPATPSVGVAATPPNPRPPTPTNTWSAISEEIAVVHYPNGWVREGVDADRIVPGLWWITERYTYIFSVTG